MKKINFKDSTIVEDIKKFIEVLKKNKLPITKIILFGSYAKNKQKKYSDIDLAVISPIFGKDELKEMMLLSKLSWQASDRIEAIPLGEKFFLKSKYHPLVAEIKKYGKVIY